MSKYVNSIPIALVKERYAYDPTSGILINKIKHSHVVTAGAQAGCKNKNGYFVVQVNGKQLAVHRVCWAIHYGEQPPCVIDHMDGNPSNNAIANLRKSNPFHNAQNQIRPQKRNKCNFLGVYEMRGKFRGAIKIGSRIKHFGPFETPEEASNEYKRMKRIFHEGCSI